MAYREEFIEVDLVYDKESDVLNDDRGALSRLAHPHGDLAKPWPFHAGRDDRDDARTRVLATGLVDLDDALADDVEARALVALPKDHRVGLMVHDVHQGGQGGAPARHERHEEW